ncbi:MAG: hypothetical protein VKI81_07085, partial [Synechococcaceae cyanobacterium]|nr:hypothetical protein [Synechococcaceae cyanobacterium]
MPLPRRSGLLAALLTVSIGGTAGALLPPALAQMPMDPHGGHGDPHREHGEHRDHGMEESEPSGGARPHGDHGAHLHDVGPAGRTYDLRFLDAMVQHHTGALRMSEFVFD